MKEYRLSRKDQMQLSAYPAMAKDAIRIFLYDEGFDLDKPIEEFEDSVSCDIIYRQEN
jgi:hypothetical protein